MMKGRFWPRSLSPKDLNPAKTLTLTMDIHIYLLTPDRNAYSYSI